MQRRRIPEGIWIEPTPRWVRAYFGGAKIADSRRALLMFEKGPIPTYWFPLEDVNLEHLTAEDRTSGSETKFWTLQVGDRVAEKAARSQPDPASDRAELKDHIALYWDKMDSWYEEDDEVFVHPRDPYNRVDVLHSSRRVRIDVEGETVAETVRPALLFETSLPTRYYIPKQDVRMDLLVPTSTTSSCPYKGVASYWSVRVGNGLVKDIVWGYPAPISECPKIENLLCFYNEKVDVFIDGEREERPTTEWT
ncbi:MAG: DUF427 domain-containing protein [Candidatus Dormibacteria bacterium]